VKSPRVHAIRTEKLSMTYRTWRSRVTVLKGLDLQVERGEIFGYLGPNGAGKTTTLKLLAGFARPTSGRAWLFGTPVGDDDARRDVGFMPEHPAFPPHLRCQEILTMSGRLSGLSGRDARSRARSLLARAGLDGVATQPVRHLSKGLLQWLGLAHALMGRPHLLILDEPMSGLDPGGRRRMRDLILEERARGTSVFFSSHILADVEMICDRVGILLDGEIVQCGRLDEILDREMDRLEVRAEGLAELTTRSMERLGARVGRVGAETLIEVDGVERANRVLDEVRGGGGRVRSITARRQSLEEYFLRHVGRETRGAEVNGADPNPERVVETVEAGYR